MRAANQGGRTKDKAKILTEELRTKDNVKTNGSFKPCGMLWERLHLTAEGNLTACCVDYENDLVYKKFSKKEKIINQFNSEKIVNLRKKHLNNNLENTICYNCIYNENTNFQKIDKSIVKKVKNNKINITKLKSLKNRLNQFSKKN